MSPIQIHVNGEMRLVAEGTSVADIVAALEPLPQALATGVNGEFVAREARASHVLRNDDVLTLFQPITGG